MGKDEIVLDIGRRQLEIIRNWKIRSVAQVHSLEGHINRLFLDLSSNIKNSPLLIRSLFTLTFQNEMIRRRNDEQFRELYEGLLRWLPDRDKVDMLINVYIGTLMFWSLQDGADLERMMRDRLNMLWNGMRYSIKGKEFIIEPELKEEKKMETVVIGGGLAGLTAAAYLSEMAGIQGILFERSPQLGGRAFTYEKSGFTLNYGAHAIYGIDRHIIGKLENELGLSFSSNQVDKRKVMYEKNEKVSPAPLDFVNLVKTDVLSIKQKVRFVGEITAIIANIHRLKQYANLGDYLAESNADEDVKELWEHLVCSNFFISPEDARKVPGSVINEYYQNLFLSTRPVNYIFGKLGRDYESIETKNRNLRKMGNCSP